MPLQAWSTRYTVANLDSQAKRLDMAAIQTRDFKSKAASRSDVYCSDVNAERQICDNHPLRSLNIELQQKRLMTE